jgi:fatty acid desaturase
MTSISASPTVASPGPLHAPGLGRDPYSPYRQVLLAPERVRELSRLRPWRVVRDTALCWGLISGAWLTVALYPQWWVVGLALPLVGSSYYGLFIIGHDGMHRRLFARRWLNDFWNDCFGQGPIGAVTHINNRNHLRHHQYLASDDDPDRHKHACFNKADHGELIGFVSGLLGMARTARNVFRPDRGQQRRAEEESSDSYTARDIAIIGAVQLTIAGGLTWAVGWWAYPALWLLPVFLFTYLADNLRSFCEHSQPRNDRESDGRRLISYVSTPIERWFLAPMNMNLHAAHHLWPSIPYYNLPIADAEMRERPAAAGVEWRSSYLGYLLRYWLALPLEECRGGRAAPALVAGAALAPPRRHDPG